MSSVPVTVAAAARRRRALLLPLGLLAVLLATGCVRARITETEGRRVTFAWDAEDTRISRVHGLAITWCHRWRAPPALLEDRVEGTRHTTTFVCRRRDGLPVNRIL